MKKYQRGDTTGLVIFAVLAVLLLVSLAGNAWFWNERDDLLQKEATVKQLQADTKAAAEACTASVDGLAKQGRARDARIEKALNGIAPQVRADQQAAMKALAARPDDPKDLCGSLDRFRREALKKDRGTK